MGIEDPEPDWAEQQRPAADDGGDDAEDTVGAPAALPLEADPADVAEQLTVVPDDEEDAGRTE